MRGWEPIAGSRPGSFEWQEAAGSGSGCFEWREAAGWGWGKARWPGGQRKCRVLCSLRARVCLAHVFLGRLKLTVPAVQCIGAYILRTPIEARLRERAGVSVVFRWRFRQF